MILPSQSSDVPVQPVQSILKAQASKHKGALIGCLMNGGRISIDGFIIEFIADASDFRTVQIWECAKGITPRIQTFNRTKVVKEKVTVYKKPPKEQVQVRQFVNQGEEEI